MHFAEESLHKYRQSAKATCRTFESESGSATGKKMAAISNLGCCHQSAKATCRNFESESGGTTAEKCVALSPGL